MTKKDKSSIHTENMKDVLSECTWQNERFAIKPGYR